MSNLPEVHRERASHNTFPTRKSSNNNRHGQLKENKGNLASHPSLQYTQRDNIGLNPSSSQSNSFSNAQNQAQLMKSQEKQEIKKYLDRQRNHDIKGINFIPRGIRFANQNIGEEVFIIVRSHWFVNFGWVFNNIIYALIPLVIAAVVSFFQISLPFLSILTNLEWLILGIFYYSIILTNTFRDYVDWYFDPYIVTNERIVHYEFNPFTNYEVIEASLQNIEDVKERSAGIIAGIFGYGDILIRTASEREFVFKKVPNPTVIRNIVTDLSKVSKSFNSSHGGRL